MPPPKITAYFCKSLRLGIVFLVQQTLVLNFFIFKAKRLVLVAIPVAKPKKLRAVRSAFKIELFFPKILIIVWFFLILLPSLNFVLIFNLESTAKKTFLESSIPHKTPCSFEVIWA